MVTSINGNNVTWRDSKTGNLITDIHEDLELVNSRRNEMPSHYGRNGSNGRKKRQSSRSNMNKCPAGQHWMPPRNGQPGHCMDNSAMPGMRRSGPTTGNGTSNQTAGKRQKNRKGVIGGNRRPLRGGDAGGTNETQRRRSYKRRRAVRKPRRGRSQNRGGGNNTGMTPQRSSAVVNRQRGRTQSPRTATPKQTGIQGKINQSAARYYFQDGTPYSGKVLKLGNDYWTTKTGAKEGNSQRVTRTPLGEGRR